MVKMETIISLSPKRKPFFKSLFKKIFRKEKAGIPKNGSSYDFGHFYSEGLKTELSQDCSERFMSEKLQVESPKTSFCKLCLEHCLKEEMYSLAQCHCQFCKECLKTYFSSQIKEANVILPCPDGDCSIQGQVEEREIRELIPNNMIPLFDRFKLNHEVEADPNRCWCPKENCSAICYFRVPPEGQSGAVFCYNCKYLFCNQCKKQWHARRTCQEIHDSQMNAEKWSQSQLTKLCPKCFAPIEKNAGCPQMQCRNCTTVFCWHCLSRLDGDFFDTHYLYGNCVFFKKSSQRKVSFTKVILTYSGILVVACLLAPALICCTPLILFMMSRKTN